MHSVALGGRELRASTVGSNHNLKRWGKGHLGDHNMVRRSGPTWRGIDLGAERVRVMRGTDWDQSCNMDTKDDGRMLNESSYSRREGFLTETREVRKLKGKKKSHKERVQKAQGEKFEVVGFMAQKELWSIAEKKMLEDRRTLPKEDGYLLREYQTMHEETCLSSRLREDVEGKDEEWENVNKDATEEDSKSGKREERKGKGGD